MTEEEKKYIKSGIASYKQEQEYLLGIIKDGITASEFDKIFYGKSRTFSTAICHSVNKDSFILGGMFGSERDWYLELLQCMLHIGTVDVKEDDSGIIYSVSKEQ